MPDENLAEGVGQDGPVHEVTEKYDSVHGKYVDNVKPGAPTVNANPAAPDPSPFKLGPT